MSARNDGGPAFPREETQERMHGRFVVQPGMSLRDWFAGQALAGLLASSALPNGGNVWSVYKDEAAQEAYAVADAMLAERARAELPAVTKGDNARLIAAAPEMLDALRAAVARMEASPPLCHDREPRHAHANAIGAARAAIAKATGAAP